jgi:fructosamine-3-kinase
VIHERLRVAVGAALDSDVTRMARLGGGDVAESFRCTLSDDRVVFAKTHLRPPPGFFTTEAAGLMWLRGPAVVPVPEVLAVSDGDDLTPPHLVLEWIDEGRPDALTEAALGRSLAALHRAGAPSFGREDRRSTGSRGLPNEPCDSWVEFFATQRLGPLHRLASDGHALSATALAKLEAVTGRLAELGGAPEPAARLHGDLWAGNRLVDVGGRSWLIDPAAHGGHREFDLAMMRLFGGYGADCFAAYEDDHPLADGWERRVPLHQLAPLVVHAIKFGGGYAGTTERALDAILSA